MTFTPEKGVLHFPPVIWFERVVNTVMNRLISDITGVKDQICEAEDLFYKRKFGQADKPNRY